jgi:TatD DNase family protein
VPDGASPDPPEPLAADAVDSHCHLDLGDGGRDHGGAAAAWAEVEAAVSAAAAVGVTRVVQVGCDVASSRWSVEAARRMPSVVATVALHPNEAPRLEERGGRRALEQAWAQIEALAADERVRAIGETGLDHYRTGPEGRGAQEESYRRHIDLAKRRGLALVIHDRDAHEDVLRVLEDEGAPERVVFHCFSGDVSMARQCAERGYVLSFAGTVTFKNAGGQREALAATPVDQVLVETDAPYLAPAPHRGRPNASYLVPVTLRAMGEVLGVGADELARATTATALRVFGAWPAAR